MLKKHLRQFLFCVSEKECKEKLTEIGFKPNMFAMVCFCDQWYAVNMTGYDNFVVVSAENVIYKVNYYSDSVSFTPIVKMSTDKLPFIADFVTDNKLWADGIENDLKQMDGDIRIKVHGRNVINDALIANNVIVTFGREFNRTEICIRTKGYIEEVFPLYYSENSLKRYIYKKVYGLRNIGTEYYNPFLGTCSGNEGEKTRKIKKLLSECKSFDDLSVENGAEAGKKKTSAKKKDATKVKNVPVVSRNVFSDSDHTEDVIKVEQIVGKKTGEHIKLTIHGVEHDMYMESVVSLYRELQYAIEKETGMQL